MVQENGYTSDRNAQKKRVEKPNKIWGSNLEVPNFWKPLLPLGWRKTEREGVTEPRSWVQLNKVGQFSRKWSHRGDATQEEKEREKNPRPSFLPSSLH